MSDLPVGTPPVPYKSRRGWLIAFGVVEILFGSLIVLVLLAILRFSGNLPQQAPMSPAGFRIFAVVFYGCMAAVFLAIGVGSTRCKNWARIAMLAVSALWLGAGVLATLLVLLLIPRIMQQQGGIPSEARHTAVVLVNAIMGFIMVFMPAVFLFFYSRKSVKATCLSHSAGEVPAAARPSSKAPVPLIILAILQGLSVFAIFGLLMVRATIVFGAVVRGPMAFLLVLAYSCLGGCAAWLIYRRRFIGWTIALCGDAFWTASIAATFALRGDLRIYRELGLSEQQLRTYQQFPQLAKVTWGVSLLLMMARLVFILYTKKYFSQAGTEAASGSLSS